MMFPLIILLAGTNNQVFQADWVSCLSSSRGVWACTTSTSGEISHIYASCSSTRPMKRRPKRTDKAELMAECQRQVQFGCWPAGRCCHRPRPPPTSPAAAAAKARCTAGQGHQAPVPVQMGTVYGSSGRGMLMVSNRAGELAGRASGKGAGGAAASPSRQTIEFQFASPAAAQPVPAAAAGRGPENPQNTPDTTQQDKPQPKGTHNQTGSSHQDVVFVNTGNNGRDDANDT